MPCHHHKQLKNVEVVEEKHEQIDNNNKQKEINLSREKRLKEKKKQIKKSITIIKITNKVGSQ